MSVAFFRGTTTQSDDLNITIRDSLGAKVDPFSISYAVFDVTSGVEVLIGSPAATPVHVSTGEYFAEVTLPGDANIGDWLVRWTFKETAATPVLQSVQEFNVVQESTVLSFTGDARVDSMIASLRILLRDNNPDRNYRFRPPANEKFIQGQTQVFGYIWEDHEILEYLLMAVDDFNTYPPVTDITLEKVADGSGRRWRTAILLRAGAFAMMAITINWIADEFSYTISGVSLDIEKSSKYQAMKDNLIGEYDKVLDAAKRSIKIIKGLRQFKYGIGITSALGPLSRSGVQSRRNMSESVKPFF